LRFERNRAPVAAFEGRRSCMVRHVGRGPMIGIAAILAVFLITEFAMPNGSASQQIQQAQAILRR